MTELEKRPAEKLLYSMDFSDLLDTDETISSITSIEATLQNCSGGNSTLILSGESIDTDGLFITTWAESGEKNETYKIVALVVTNSSQIRQGEGILSIREK